MKNNESTSLKAIKGAGYLIGALTGIVAAVVTFIITENIAVSIPVLAGLSLPIGIIIEKKLQDGAVENEKRSQKMMIAIIAAGVLFLLSLIFITKLI